MYVKRLEESYSEENKRAKLKQEKTETKGEMKMRGKARLGGQRATARRTVVVVVVFLFFKKDSDHNKKALLAISYCREIGGKSCILVAPNEC